MNLGARDCIDRPTSPDRQCILGDNALRRDAPEFAVGAAQRLYLVRRRPLHGRGAITCEAPLLGVLLDVQFDKALEHCLERTSFAPRRLVVARGGRIDATVGLLHDLTRALPCRLEVRHRPLPNR